jgi:Ribbon-helix-helix protein, copG family
MATPTLRTTYALDLPTAEGLQRLAQHWGTSKSEVIRRMTREALAKIPADHPAMTVEDIQPVDEKAAQWLATLKELQRRMQARGVDFEAWHQAVQDMRR